MVNKKILNGVSIQLATVLLLIIQALVVPLIIGMEDYGRVMFHLTPVLFFAAIFEAISQHATMKKTEGTFLYVVNFFVFTIASILIFQYVNNIRLSLETVLVIFCSLSLFISTWSQACFYSKGNLPLVSKALMTSFISALIFVSASKLFGFVNEYMYYWMFILSQASAFTYLLYMDKKEKLATLTFNFSALNIEWKVVYESISWRVNTVMFTVVFLYLVGVFYSPKVVGETKYIFTILMGLRFFCPYNTPMIHSYFKNNNDGYLIIFKILAFYSICCFVIYYFGKAIITHISMDQLNFIFNYPLYFIVFAIILTSNAIGSYFTFNNSSYFLNVSTLISFSFCYLLLLKGETAEHAFSIGLIAYIFIIFTYVFFKKYNNRVGVS